ncbi:hypothetical protein VTK56DRAFT_1826 [Thermocarpiscus australiensis]
MDLRSYDLPIHPSYSPYPRVLFSGAESHPRSPREYRRHCSFSDPSLSDDAHPGQVHHRGGSIRKRDPMGSSGSRESKREESKKPAATLRNQNPGVDLALRNLSHELGVSLKNFQAFAQSFEDETEQLRDWAEEYTLDTIWKNKVKANSRERRDREVFGGMAGRILWSRATIKDSVAKAKALKATWDDKYKIERQIRTAKKALLYCDGIVDLAERAASERLACKQLLLELEEAADLLDRKKHPWICKTASVQAPVATSPKRLAAFAGL